MKTVFITIFHGHIARNFLLTPILPLLKNNKSIRVVVICPEAKVDYYTEHFGGGNFIFEGTPPLTPTHIDNFFRMLYYYFVDSDTVRLLQGEKYILQKKYLRYFFSRFLTKIFGNIKSLRVFIRFLDRKFIKPQGYGFLFDTYKPDLVFITSITSDQDSMVLREADRRDIPNLGMVRSWDNFASNKGNVRIYPKKLLVHNRFLADDSVKLADFKEADLITVGMPHFDFYVNEKRLTREDVCKQLGADPTKKFIFFMLIGPSSARLDKYIIEYLEKLIEKDEAFKDFQLIVRPHPNTGKVVEKVSPKTMINYPKVVDFGSARLTDREFTKEDMEIFSSLITHAAVVVSYQGTGTVDTVALGRPIINIAFDDKDVPYFESVKHQYDWTHVKPIVATGGVRVVWSEDELRNTMLECDEHPDHDLAGRKQIISDQCYMLDGKASERVIHEIEKTLT